MTNDSPAKPPIPELPADATPEEKDRHWYRHVYQGDTQPQLTIRAIVMGSILGFFMAWSNLYTTLKLGWAFGVAITACVLSFLLWNLLRTLSGNRLTQMSLLENNCMQSTASAAGYSTGGTVGSAIAALFLIEGGHRPVWVVVCFVFLTAGLGVLLAIPMKRQMINHERLPFPSGIAAAETLRSLYSHGAEAIRKAWMLVAGMLIGGIVAFFKSPGIAISALGEDHVVRRLAEKLHLIAPLPDEIALPGPTLAGAASGAKMAGLSFEPTVLTIGAGMIMGLRISLSMLAGSAIIYFIIAPILVAQDVANVATEDWHTAMWKPGAEVIVPFRWAVWGGTSVMVISSLTALALQWKTVARSFRLFGKKDEGGEHAEIDAAMAKIEVPNRWLIIGLIPITIGLMIVLVVAFDMNPLLALVAVAMSFILALVACRATGETDTTPIGAMGKVTQLAFAGLAPQNATINLMAAGTTSGAAGSAADLLTDLKSGYLLGANPRRQFIAQALGILSGTAAVVIGWFLIVKDQAALEKFPLPAAQAWKAMADLLEKGPSNLNYGAISAILVGAGLGILLPLIEKMLPKARRFMPSPMGLGLGLIIPFASSLSFGIGAVIGWIWKLVNKKQADDYTIPLASGLVAGEGMILAIVTIVCALLALSGG
jgi:OPT family oligopeptide transporter